MNPAHIHPDLAEMAARHARTRRKFRTATIATGRLARTLGRLADIAALMAVVFVVYQWRTGRLLLAEPVPSAALVASALLVGAGVMQLASWLFRRGTVGG